MSVSAAASLSGNLLAVGGHKDGIVSSVVHAFLPITNSWVRLGRDMPEPRFGSTAVPLLPNKLFVSGGNDDGHALKRYGVWYHVDSSVLYYVQFMESVRCISLRLC